MAYQLHLYTCENPSSVRPNQEFFLSAKALPPKCVREADSFDDNALWLHTIIIPYAQRAGLDMNRLKRALSYEFSSHGCDHEYDCCGCRVASAYTHTLKRVSRGVFTMLVSEGRNY